MTFVPLERRPKFLCSFIRTTNCPLFSPPHLCNMPLGTFWVPFLSPSAPCLFPLQDLETRYTSSTWNGLSLFPQGRFLPVIQLLPTMSPLQRKLSWMPIQRTPFCPDSQQRLTLCLIYLVDFLHNTYHYQVTTSYIPLLNTYLLQQN